MLHALPQAWQWARMPHEHASPWSGSEPICRLGQSSACLVCAIYPSSPVVSRARYAAVGEQVDCGAGADRPFVGILFHLRPLLPNRADAGGARVGHTLAVLVLLDVVLLRLTVGAVAVVADTLRCVAVLIRH